VAARGARAAITSQTVFTLKISVFTLTALSVFTLLALGPHASPFSNPP
jgi:hypothetical protein